MSAKFITGGFSKSNGDVIATLSMQTEGSTCVTLVGNGKKDILGMIKDLCLEIIAKAPIQTTSTSWEHLLTIPKNGQEVTIALGFQVTAREKQNNS